MCKLDNLQHDILAAISTVFPDGSLAGYASRVIVCKHDDLLSCVKMLEWKVAEDFEIVVVSRACTRLTLSVYSHPAFVLTKFQRSLIMSRTAEPTLMLVARPLLVPSVSLFYGATRSFAHLDGRWEEIADVALT